MGNFNILPTEIKLEILTRLPTETVLDCKLVCKPWRNLVSHHPSFSRMHLTHLNHFTDSLNHSTDSSKSSFLVFSEKPVQLCYFEYNEQHGETPAHSYRRFNFTPPFKSSEYNVIGSVNGLVCLYGGPTNAAYCVCNPVTKESAMLPSCKRCYDDMYRFTSNGFGYLPSTNEYKIVEVHWSRKERDCIQVWVYTLGSGHGWRSVARFDSTLPQSVRGVCMNGALYWTQDPEDYAAEGQSLYEAGGRLLVFDLTVEKFREHVSAPPSPLHAEYAWTDYCIGDLGGVLYCAIQDCSELRDDAYVDIWLLKKKDADMKEQVENEPLGWTKEFSLPDEVPLAITKSGGVLFHNFRSLSVYYPKTSTIEKLIDPIKVFIIFPHKNTFVSLKQLGEEDIKILEPAEIEEIESRDSTA